MTQRIIAFLNRHTRTCDTCLLPYGHGNGHIYIRPTLREWISGWLIQGREGDETGPGGR